MADQWTRDELTDLRDVLADLYPKRQDVQRILWDLGFKESRFDLDGSASGRWTSVLQELSQQPGDVEKALALAAKEYPRNVGVVRIQSGLSRRVEGSSAPVIRPSPVVATGPVTQSRSATDAMPAADDAPATTWKVSAAPRVDFRKLSGPQWRALQEALVSAFPSYEDLKQLVMFHFDTGLETVTANAALGKVMFDLIQWSQSRGWTERLFYAARAERPDNPEIMAFGLSVTEPASSTGGESVADSGLEQILRRDVPTVKLADLLATLGLIQGRTCRVEVGGKVEGTGFLVGTSAVMTNYHVLREVIEKRVRPDDVAVRFDYRDGYQGTIVRMESDWLIDASPYAPFETARPDGGTPQPDQLDYAVVRVRGRPGKSVVGGGNPTPHAPERGFVKLPAGDLALMVDEALFIVQHPAGRTMEIAIETRGVIGYNANRTRVKHRVNTEGGSSGSPVFNLRGDLVALHHAGDSAKLPLFNQAVPVDAIRRLLEQRDKLGELGR